MDDLELLPRLAQAGGDAALRIDGRWLTYRELALMAGGLANRLQGCRRVAIHATSSLETIVALLGALAAGTSAIPVNPASGALELEHMLEDSDPELVLAPARADLPAALAARPRLALSGDRAPFRELVTDAEHTAVILYTSGTTGLPKGVEIPRRAIASNIDALACMWGWAATDRLTHALPLFHVHGLVLGVLGPLRLGGSVDHVGRFSAQAVAGALRDGASVVFGVPTMYHRLAIAAEQDDRVAGALASARLLVSGSAPLPTVDHARVERACGQRIVERYGMTETLINTAVAIGGERLPGCVGVPVPGVGVRLHGENGEVIDLDGGAAATPRPHADELQPAGGGGDRSADREAAIGEVAVRGPNLFKGYLNREQATADSMRDGWFMTGDLATIAPNGYLRLLGRRSSDLIKSGGYRIGAGEVEGALLEHPAVAEVAVAGEPDPDLGERVIAWVVAESGTSPSPQELISHSRTLLASHKCPREIRLLEDLPRNAMGKVLKRELPPHATKGSD